MPNYRGPFGHRNQTLVMSVALCAVPLLTGDWRDLLVPAGCLCGLKLSPDMDLKPGALGLLGRLMFVDEYAMLVPHRSIISHTPLLGTVVRFALLGGIPIVLVGLLFRWWVPWWAILRFAVGLTCADLLHIIADTAWSKLRTKEQKVKVYARRRRS